MQKLPDMPVPANEQQRLETLWGYNILDTVPEKQFDDLTKLASIICESPITLISLVDSKRQWFKSKIGVNTPEMPRAISVCQYTILQDGIFEVEDALEDDRFAKNPLVIGPPNIRYYAGATLRTSDGFNLGTLCIFDQKPRKLTENQRKALIILANEVVMNMELRKERNNSESEKKKVMDSSELLNIFLENSPSLITMKDLKGNYLFANKKMLDTVGKTDKELLGRHTREILDAGIVDQIEREEQQVIKTKECYISEYEMMTNGTTRYYDRYVFPLIDGEGNVTGVGTISNDKTESHVLSYELQLSNQRFASLFYNSPIALVIADMESGEFIMANNTFLEVFGYKLEEVIGKKEEELQLLVDPLQGAELGKELMEKGHVRDREFKLFKKNGEVFFVLSSVDLIQVDGRTQAVSAFQDITERKKIELKLQEAKKEAEAATYSKSMFLANMSHEIRTPLNAMLGFSELLNRTDLTLQQKEYASIIDTSGRNLLAIINDILDFSKIEAGMMTIEKTPFSPQQILHSVFTMFSSRAQNKNLKLLTSIDPETPSLVVGDPTRLNQVMANLIGNAIKFTGEGSVSVDCSVLMRTNDRCKLKISVKDTGIGISREKLDRIFDRFTQAEDSTTRTFGGTGLGLSIAKRLLELQGGEIAVISEPGKGSEFYFTLEYEVSESKAYAHHESALPVARNSFEGKRILLVEDNLLNQKLAMALLGGEGFEITTAENGQLAVDILAEEKFDIILMDIQMPILDGYEATAKIRNELKCTTPIIAMTANAMTGEHEHCLSMGMDDYITKPFKSELLLSKIDLYLRAAEREASNESGWENQVTNLAFLNDFSAGNETFVKEMIAIFLDKNPGDVSSLETAIENKDFPLIKSVAHNLQTSVLLIGFPEKVIEDIRTIESLAAESSGLEAIRDKATFVATVCSKARRELRTLI